MDFPLLRISVVLITPDSFATIRRTCKHLAAQTICPQIELLLCTPSAATLQPDDSLLAGFGAVRILETADCRVVARVKAMAVRAATAPSVAFIEEHAFPSPEWAEQLAAALEDGYAAAGPRMVNANPSLPASWANFVIEYGPWAEWSERRHPQHLPGNNGSYSRDALLALGPALEPMLDAESLVHWDFVRHGKRLIQVPEARVVHLNITRFSSFWPVHFHYSRMFAASRSEGWPLWKRLLYAGGGFLIPLIRLRRHWPDVQRVTPRSSRGLAFAAWLALGLASAGLGEIAGYLAGTGEARVRIYWLEFHRPRHLAPTDPALDQFGA